MPRTFDPFREMDRWFGETSRPLALPLDLVRTGDEFVAYIDLPGVDPSTIDIDAEERTLTIRAQRHPVVDAGDQQWLVRERPSGMFARQMTLGAGLALDKVEATYVDGVLTLRIPVAEAAKPRKISVTTTAENDGRTVPGEASEPTDPATAEQLDIQGDEAVTPES